MTTAQATNWYVLYTRPRAEKKCAKALALFDFECYLPLLRQHKPWKDRIKTVDTPLFHSYIFVNTNEKKRYDVFHIGGILKFISIKGKLAILSNEEIEKIKKLCTFDGNIIIEENTLALGDEVEILSGILAGIKGTLINKTKKNKIRISINGLGCYAVIDIEKEIVKKAA
jgi:transcription antitermination factor NusG